MFLFSLSIPLTHPSAEINIILIIVIVVVFVAVVAVGGLFYYHYYRTKRMGKYTLKDVFRLGRQHTAVPITE